MAQKNVKLPTERKPEKYCLTMIHHMANLPNYREMKLNVIVTPREAGTLLLGVNPTSFFHSLSLKIALLCLRNRDTHQWKCFVHARYNPTR